MSGKTLASTALVLVAGVTWASAQPAGQVAPPHASVVAGHVLLEHAGAETTLAPSTPVAVGDRLRSATGRAQLLLSPGVLHVDRETTLDLESRSTWRLSSGRLHLVTNVVGESTERGRVTQWAVHLGDAMVSLESPGDYGIRLTSAEARVTVWRGAATLRLQDGSVLVSAGQQLSIVAGSPSLVQPAEVRANDDFLTWVRKQLEMRLWTDAGSPPLPDELLAYRRTLNTQGVWQDDPQLGPIWFPTVSAAWRPYSAGRWMHAASIGTTWVGTESWSWPTHHYGRWGIRDRAWYWVPSSRWSAGWVTWAIAPGIVGWCALGVDDRPAAPLRDGSDLFEARGAYEPREGWTFSSREAFDAARPTTAYSPLDSIRGPNRSHLFVTQRTGPRVRGRSGTGRAASAPVVQILGSRARGTISNTRPSPRAVPHPRPSRPGRTVAARASARTSGSATPGSAALAPGASLPALRRDMAGAPDASTRSSPTVGRATGLGLRQQMPTSQTRPPSPRPGRAAHPPLNRRPLGVAGQPGREQATPRSEPAMKTPHLASSGGLVVGRGPTRRGRATPSPLASGPFRRTVPGRATGAIRRQDQ